MLGKGLSTLIRLGKWTVDEKRRKLGELLGLVEHLYGEKRRLEEELVAEQQVAAASQEASLTYDAFARAVIDRREKLNTSIAEIERQIAATREELAEAFRELKSFEITQAAREKREAEKLAREDRAALDEIGLQSFRRRQGNDT